MEQGKPQKGRAKGRARGRARGSSAETPGSSAPATATGEQQPAQPRSRAQYRGNERPGGLQARQIDSQPPTSALAALKIDVSTSGDNGNDNGNGNGGRPLGRGVTRGKREINITRILRTKPESMEKTSKFGKAGNTINLLVNYFGVGKIKNWKLVAYHVYFNPEQENTRERKKLLRQHHQRLGEGYIFDGTLLYVSRLLGDQRKDIELVSKDEGNDLIYQIKLKFIKELETDDCQFIQLLNIILSRCQDHLGLKLMGRNYYNCSKAKELKEYNVSVLPGIFTSIRQFENSLLLNVDVSHKVLRNDSVLDIFNKVRGNREKFEQLVIGSVVLTDYNEKTYLIDDIEFNVTPRSTFSYQGQNKTYLAYYEEKYKRRIRVENQPMLCSKPKKRDRRRGMTGNIYLVPELCKVTGISDEMRSDYQMTSALAQYTRMAPDMRVRALKEFNTDLMRNEKVQKELNHWGLRLEPELVRVQGRVLAPEKLYLGNIALQAGNNGDWSQGMKSSRLNDPKEFRNWAIIYPDRLSSDANELYVSMMRACRPMGIVLSDPKKFPLSNDSVASYINSLNACAGMQIVMILLMHNKGERYASIKKHASVNLAIPSQCVLAKTLSKKQRLMSVATKIAIQMNCKLGGDVWRCHVPMTTCMIVGYDTYHDSIRKGDSFGAFISSVDPSWTKYYGQVSRHSNREELTDKFGIAMKNSLEQYQKTMNKLPNIVIVYRDGVGDGQIRYVMEHEITAIKNTFERVGKSDIKLAFVIVSKRINTRLFGDQGQGRVFNPPPGTVVDNIITLPERYDFFLVPQSVNQGTVTPTSFNVVYDEVRLSPDQMQCLAYKLTHLYYNWQGTVRVPAPCLYAHKLAFLTGTSIHEVPHARLADRLWYL